MTQLICIAGAESSGKSLLATALADHFGTPLVPEYAREYCAAHGNDLTLAQLQHVAATQDAMIRAALAAAQAAELPVLIADTDALVTAVWIATTLGDDAAAAAITAIRPDLYLVTANDLDWQDDGLRIQRDARQRADFRRVLAAMIADRGLRWAGIGGSGPLRLQAALAAIQQTYPDWPDPRATIAHRTQDDSVAPRC